MKNISLFLLLTGSVAVQSQEPQHQCGHEQVIEIQKNNSAHYNEQLLQINQQVKIFIEDLQQNKAKGNQSATYIIPVVFHVVHSSNETYGTGSNISYARILSQMNALNAAFAKDYPNYNQQNHAAYAQNTNIQFCLAKTAMPSTVSFYNGPQGIENGVMRYASTSHTQHQITNTSASALLSLTHPTSGHFPFQNYLNIWVVSSIGSGSGGTIMAYAPTPLMNSFPLDGVITRADIIGDNSTGNNFPLGFNLQQGKVLSHEIGHYLNLYHTFHGGCAGANGPNATTDACDLNGDYICDTEPALTQNYNCNLPVPNTCAANYNTGTTTMDMIENYMSYSGDNCMNTFTMDQCLRMWATLNNLRSGLWQTSNLSATGLIGAGSCIPPFLIGNITLQNNNVCSGISFQVSNPVAGNSATGRVWTFTGGSPATSNSASVNVTYPNPGNYWIKLTVNSGTLTLSDSVLVTAINCVLDSGKLDRSHWFFGDYAEINFATIPVSSGNSAFIHKTMTNGYESTVSMSDRKGNLLFYTNGLNLWDNQHQKINATTPIFHTGSSGSTPGMLSFPFPNDSSRYIIISSPHSGINYDSLYYVIYDTAQHTLTKRRGFRHPSLPAKFAEPLTAVPHCNGIDYWIICRPYPTFNHNKAYSILLTPNGPGAIDTVIVSSNVTDQWSGQFKSNSQGNRLVQADFNADQTIAFLYDFDHSTGIVSNEVPVTTNVVGGTTGAIFSPNDSIIYCAGSILNQGGVIWKTNLSTMQTAAVTTPANMSTLQFEVGPDNNIYMTQTNFNNTTTARLINCDNYSGVSFAGAVITYSTGMNPFGGLCNFVDAKKGPVIAPFLYQSNPSCSVYTFSVDNCWSFYKSSWAFGDGGLATGPVVSHTYSAPGIYSVSLVLSIGNYSLPVTVQTVQIGPAAAAIAGPTVLCKGSTYLNSYNTGNLSGASYTWSAVNGTILSPSNQHQIDLAGIATGNATLTLQMTHHSCISTTSMIILVDTIPAITISSPQAICLSKSTVLTATPSGGVFSGTGMTGPVFNPSSAGNHVISYAVANVNGCSNTQSANIAVNYCVEINEYKHKNILTVYPNPGSGFFTIDPGEEGQHVEIFLYNAFGELILERAGSDLSLDISHRANGIYYLKVSRAAGIEYFRLIKTSD